MASLTIGYVTARNEPHFDWFFYSLYPQFSQGNTPKIILVDSLKESRLVNWVFADVLHVAPKPTVWQGKSRLTKEDWWAVSNARNTALCLCETDYIVWLDDRCVLMPGWLKAAQDAANGGYAVCGTYEKRRKMKVENGKITEPGELDGKDARFVSKPTRPVPAWTIQAGYYGGSLGMPLKVALEINGFEELCDGLGMEDVIAGRHLTNAACPMMFDARMKIIEDRSNEPEALHNMKRDSKEKHPHDRTDKGHEALRRFATQKRTSHHWNLREIRERVLRGEPFPAATLPETDWFDGQQLKEM